MIVWDALERNYIKTRFKISSTKKEVVLCKRYVHCSYRQHLKSHYSAHYVLCVRRSAAQHAVLSWLNAQCDPD